jgi:hypothetical protein
LYPEDAKRFKTFEREAIAAVADADDEGKG